MSKWAVYTCAIFLLLPGMEGLHAQTIEQLQSEGEFVRKLIRARDAGDCRLALRLLDERKSVVKTQAMAVRSREEAMYLYTQMRGLEHRRTIVSKECRASH